jgi:hypothetical protein
MFFFNSGEESHENRPSFYFLYCCSFSVQIYCFSLVSWLQWDSDAFLFCCSQMNMDDYTHCTLGNDGWLHTTDRHCLGFPRVLLCTLRRHGYDGPIPEYRCMPYQAHGLPCCEVPVEIPVNPEAPWTGMVVGGDLDNAVGKMAYLALTALCEQCLANMSSMPIVLFPMQDQDEPMWHQHLEAAYDLTWDRFNVGWVQMVKCAQYLFNLHHNTSRILIAQHTCLDAYEEQPIRTS